MYPEITDFLRMSQNKGSIDFTRNQNLAELSSIGTGGSANFFVKPKCIDGVTQTVSFLEKSSISYTITGNATNILFPDQTYNGVIISLKNLNKITLINNFESARDFNYYIPTEIADSNKKILENNNAKEKTPLIYVESGANLTKLSHFAFKNSFKNFEGLFGIPGTVGGGLVTNAGAFGNEISDNLILCVVFDPQREIFRIFTKSECNFSYRNSIFANKNYVILSALFECKSGKQEEICSKMRLFKEKRLQTQPYGVKTLGSYFKKVKNTEGKLISAGEIIDKCGLKGLKFGGAEVSSIHGNFIINKGMAKSSDIHELANIIKKEVFAATGYILEEEIRII